MERATQGSRMSLTRVRCSACGRSAATDLLSRGDLVCAFVGWEFRGDRVVCTRCQWAAGNVPNVARRLRVLAGSIERGST